MRRELELETELELDFFFPLLEPVELRRSEEERPPPIKALNMLIVVDVIDCWEQGKMRSERSCPSERGDHDHVGFFFFFVLRLDSSARGDGGKVVVRIFRRMEC